ncbi:hypothetical protein [Streptomyces sp. EN16]|uniref:hypothetical protein n=1 Tax=Streptomyces sp. EN16 TaxID=212773 RepID=UPI000B028001|nr:hypothetical protein [Streptomyces sp. EN16]
MTLSELFTAFSNERTRYRDSEVRATIDRLESAAEAAMYKENEIGGEARRVVGDVAAALGVVLGDTGPRMSVWDPANMRRVVAEAQRLREDVESLNSYSARIEREREQYRTDAETLRRQLDSAQASRDELAAKHAATVDLLTMENERANAAIEREEAAEEAATEIGQYARRMERERDEHRKTAEEAEAKFRKQEHGCETPESHAYGCPCVDEPIKFRGGSITLSPDPMTAEIRFDSGPWDSTTWFVEGADPEDAHYGVRIDGVVWYEFLRAVSTVNPGDKALRTELTALREAYEKVSAAAARFSEAYSDRIGRHVETYAERDELKATIVSQAREIARLKGESA